MAKLLLSEEQVRQKYGEEVMPALLQAAGAKDWPTFVKKMQNNSKIAKDVERLLAVCSLINPPERRKERDESLEKDIKKLANEKGSVASEKEIAYSIIEIHKTEAQSIKQLLFLNGKINKDAVKWCAENPQKAAAIIDRLSSTNISIFQNEKHGIGVSKKWFTDPVHKEYLAWSAAASSKVHNMLSNDDRYKAVPKGENIALFKNCQQVAEILADSADIKKDQKGPVMRDILNIANNNSSLAGHIQGNEGASSLLVNALANRAVGFKVKEFLIALGDKAEQHQDVMLLCLSKPEKFANAMLEYMQQNKMGEFSKETAQKFVEHICANDKNKDAFLTKFNEQNVNKQTHAERVVAERGANNPSGIGRS